MHVGKRATGDERRLRKQSTCMAFGLPASAGGWRRYGAETRSVDWMNQLRWLCDQMNGRVV